MTIADHVLRPLEPATAPALGLLLAEGDIARAFGAPDESTALWRRHTLRRWLRSQTRLIWWLSHDERPVGVARVRMEKAKGSGWLTYGVAAAFRGRGFGTQLVQQVIARLRTVAPDVSSLLAYVQADNMASHRLLRRFDFVIERAHLDGGLLYRRSL